MLNLQINRYIWYLFVISFAIAVVKICIQIAKYVVWSKKISRSLPSVKVRFFSILGHMSYLPLTEKSRNGFSLLIHVQQALLGAAKLCAQERLYYAWFFIFPVVVLSKPEAIEVVFRSTETIEKAWFYKWIQVFFGTGLFTSSGNLWRSRRKFLNTFFRKDIIKEHVPTISEQSRILVQNLEKEIHEDFTKISKPIKECTLNVMHEIVFGVPDTETLRKLKEFIRAVQWGLRFTAERMMNCFFWIDFIYFSTKKGKELKKHIKTVKDFTRSMIRKEKQKYLSSGFCIEEEKRKPLLNLLLDAHFQRSDFSEDDLADELITFIVAGQDATSVAITWTLNMLGLYPDIQAKVHEELDMIFCDDSDRHVTQSDLNKMKYLNCVIKETLRLYPPAPFFARKVHKDINICGYEIPKGTTCMVFPHVLHRNEEVFPDAERFDPDRFLPENFQGRSPYAYIPFSAGPRNCLGQNMAMMTLMIVVSTLLRSYMFETLDPRDKVLPAITINLTPSKPIRIRIRKRSSKNHLRNPLVKNSDDEKQQQQDQKLKEEATEALLDEKLKASIYEETFL